MFDITSSKLLILAIVALIVVGPKDLPLLLRTVGKYLGVVRRQAAEFRHQFDEAIREAELDQLKKDFEAAARELHATVDSGARAIERQTDAAAADAAAAAPVQAPKFATGMAAGAGVALASTESKSETGADEPSAVTAVEPATPAEADKATAEPGRGAA
jgi:sec-independent protein translocase protein TatB